MKSGIYLITCRPPGRLPLYYVGQSVNIERRFGQHKRQLMRGVHDNSKLQRYWSAHGESTFCFEILERVDRCSLNDAELWWLDQLVGNPRCFNVSLDPVAFAIGRPQSADHKAKRIAAISGDRHYSYGRPLSEEHRANISAGGRGVRRSVETRARIAAANSGANNPMFGLSGHMNPRSLAVMAVNIETGAAIRYDSAHLAEKDGFSQPQISKCCNGVIGSHKGHRWSFTQDPA